MFTTSATRHVGDGAGRRLGRGPVEARRVPRLPNHAVDAGRVGRAENRAHVVRVLDAVEHDNQRRRRGPGHEVVDAVRRRLAHLGHDALVHAAARRAIERRTVHDLDA